MLNDTKYNKVKSNQDLEYDGPGRKYAMINDHLMKRVHINVVVYWQH